MRLKYSDEIILHSIETVYRYPYILIREYIIEVLYSICHSIENICSCVI